MDNRVSFSAEQENSLLRLINGVNFDYTFVYDCENDSANVTRYADDKATETHYDSGFVDFIVSRVHPDDYSLLEKEIKKLSQLVPSMGFEVRLKEIMGRRYRWHLIRLHIAKEGGKTFYVGSSTYIDSRKNKESELTIKARQDQLTGLLNKVTTKESIETFLRKNSGSEGALIVFDIDNFKNYNDYMGHLFGDEVLKEVADRMRRLFTKDSFVGRIGGDEFLVYVKDVTDVTDIVRRMNELRSSIADITLGQKSHFRITLSIGISLYPDMGTDFDTLFKAADMALYSIKKRGKNSYAFYTDELYNEAIMKEGEEKLKQSAVVEKETGTLTDFAFKLLSESQNVSGVINLLLYKIQTEYDLEAIHVNELANDSATSAEVTYEICKEGREKRLGYLTNFTRKALKEEEEKVKEDGYFLYDFTGDEKPVPGNGIEMWEGIGSELHVLMTLFGKRIGCIDFISAKGPLAWKKQKILELVSVCNLIAVCLYYSARVSRAEKEVTWYEEYDALTGLMKEDSFIDAATKAIGDAEDNVKLAVVYSDIRNFKYINETYGYLAGDRVITAMAEYISKKEQGVHCATRLHSDNIIRIQEFPDCISDENIGRMLEDSCEKLAAYITSKTNISDIYIRSGVCIVHAGGYDLDSAISNANLARRASQGGKGTRCLVFDKEVFESKKRHDNYRRAFDKAIENKEFYVVMQPEVSSTDQKLIGAEALVRWRMADGTEVYPDDFIPAFEKDGSIIRLDFYAYEMVMTYLRTRLDAGKKIVPVSLNVSRAHFVTRDFVQRFKELVTRYEIPPQYLRLELTESLYIGHDEALSEAIEDLREFGVSVFLDDFGTGYSTLSALNELNVDLLKIDRAFMKDQNLKDSDKAILRFIIEMAKNLRVKVLCQGVESDEQRDFLNEAGCGLQQGYLYSKPVSLAVFNEYVDNEDMLFAKIG